MAPPRLTRRTRIAAALRWDHRHHDAGTRWLLIGSLGLAAVLLGDWWWLVLVKGHQVGESFLEASRVVATVGPGPTESGAIYGGVSALAMLATIVFTAMLTAGLIDRLFEPRLLGLLGPTTAPRRHHVIVVGMGQLGVRLCAQLMALNIPVVGVERDRSAAFLSLARQLGIPVFIGDGTERRVLEKLRLSRCRARQRWVPTTWTTSRWPSQQPLSRPRHESSCGPANKRPSPRRGHCSRSALSAT